MTTWSGVLSQAGRAALLETAELRNHRSHGHATPHGPRPTQTLRRTASVMTSLRRRERAATCLVLRAARRNGE